MSGLGADVSKVGMHSGWCMAPVPRHQACCTCVGVVPWQGHHPSSMLRPVASHQDQHHAILTRHGWDVGSAVCRQVAHAQVLGVKSLYCSGGGTLAGAPPWQQAEAKGKPTRQVPCKTLKAWPCCGPTLPPLLQCSLHDDMHTVLSSGMHSQPASLR